MLTTRCASTCPDRQYISIYFPNECQPCDPICELCERSSIRCSKCIIGYYLHQETFSCVTECPDGFFKDNTTTPFNHYCTKCTPGCKTCNASGLNNCPICTNVIMSDGSYVRFFKHQQENSCGTDCTVGYYGNFSTNLCNLCH
jgi:proprotein convertase subtilisin/kexin type 5